MRAIKNDLGELVCGFIPLYDGEVVGLEIVRVVAGDLLKSEPTYWSSL
jgi:hypothetical protein